MKSLEAQTDMELPAASAVLRILLVEDHPGVRKGMAMLIGQECGMVVCGQAGNIAQAFDLVESERPDLVIVDLMLNGGSGLDLIRQIRAGNAEVKILVASMHEESPYAERSFEAGADGYMNKERAAETIIDAIRQVLAGKRYLSNSGNTVGDVRQGPGRPLPSTGRNRAS